eukprot:TRINITY_DN9013_c0_g1_i7.p2 TRINITY_DN9013_c0_g1~~TRINITY_DN9013_c0_g1_i7.p2  ORF type:complete len:190 (+),score=33.48 TRINITY_DN9013_c0_g1_i7:186-755(+)
MPTESLVEELDDGLGGVGLHGDVERRLSVLVADRQVGSRHQQLLDQVEAVGADGAVEGGVAALVGQRQVGLVLQQQLDQQHPNRGVEEGLVQRRLAGDRRLRVDVRLARRERIENLAQGGRRGVVLAEVVERVGTGDVLDAGVDLLQLQQRQDRPRVAPATQASTTTEAAHTHGRTKATTDKYTRTPNR